MKKYVSLAIRYRPQRFCDVVGQKTITDVLSRAAAEGRVAPGYLLAGTRGVGKTTSARIFAKALNCASPQNGEPCNACEQCRKITNGSHPDVIEIDGASNNSVEDARGLRENIGFAPMEGRYKIFIIDEAHMLSKSAFNALLKTLEEPPRNVTFIFATTELHRFPPTILSRCQVFSFHHLPQSEIEGHLTDILSREKIPAEGGAVRLLARRAAGSVRDSMSLLDQVLAYGDETLTEARVREVLGLAGLEAVETLLNAVADGDCRAVARFARDLTAREVDIGFFVRELIEHLRSLFLLRKCDRDFLAQMGAAPDELGCWERVAPRFTPGYLHAAWQMALETQRGIATSQEPAAALELLLINLALLPSLLDVGHVGAEGLAAGGGGTPRPTGAPNDR